MNNIWLIILCVIGYNALGVITCLIGNRICKGKGIDITTVLLWPIAVVLLILVGLCAILEVMIEKKEKRKEQNDAH